MLKVAFLCVCIQLSNYSSTTPFPPIGRRRVIVPEAVVVQLEDPAPHYVSPPLNSDRGEKNVNQHTADSSHVPQSLYMRCHSWAHRRSSQMNHQIPNNSPQNSPQIQLKRQQQQSSSQDTISVQGIPSVTIQDNHLLIGNSQSSMFFRK